MFFFLKFKAQLRRTQPDIVRQVDETLSRVIADAGGKITGERSVISVVFNEETTGFWLDIYILLENLKKSMDASTEFFGYALVISGNSPNSPDLLCRFLANCGGGIFLDTNAVKKFIPYAVFEKPSEWLKGRHRKYGSVGFYRIRELKVFKPIAKNEHNLQEIVRILEQETGKNILMLGHAFSQIHGGMYKYCKKLNGNFPVLTICFGSIGLGALVDAWSPGIRSLLGKPTEKIDNLWELVFRDRIRDEVSDYIVRSVKRFLSLLFDFYFTAARKGKFTPVLALENIHLAGKVVTDVLLESLAEIKNEDKQKLLILGTGEDDIQQEKLWKWKPVFHCVKKIDANNQRALNLPRLSNELWEIVYAISLLGRYFSPELFHRLFEEDKKNPVMIARAFSILYALGVIDNPREPRLLNRNFEDHAVKLLGEKASRVKAFVSGRLLDWAVRRNINPCFRLLTIIAGLDGTRYIDDLLLLKSVSSDIVNETITGLEAAAENGFLKELFTVQKTEAVRCIFKTSMALYTGNEQDIDRVFSEPGINSVCESFPILSAQITVNLCGYYLGKHDRNAASEKAKEAILAGQNKNIYCLSQGYRLFSLVCLSKQQTTETIEYLNFALANAEKTGNYHEMGVSAYYAAAAQLLYGDLYNAQRLARKSIEQSLAAGAADWADRSRFLEGRLEFELGHYRQAHDIFEALRKEPFDGITNEKDSLLAAWIYRSKIYFHDTMVRKPEDANNDAGLFEIEAAYLAGDYQKAVDLANSMSDTFSKENFLYTERPNWRSGFSQCEHLYFSQGEIQNRMICIFHSLALSRLSDKEGQKAVQDIQRLLRNERFCEMDPWEAFYFYAKYRILEQTGASLVDISTTVSMAFKRLQRRASRIEDIETRRQYLDGPLWNRELCLAARDFKLI